MKKNVFKIFSLVFILFNLNTYSQSILERLDSPNYADRISALIEIKDNDLEEYIPELLDRIFDQPTLYLTHYFLDVIYNLNYSDIEDLIFEFIDICDEFPQEQPLYYKVRVTEFLVKINNLSTVDYVFEFVNLDPLKNGEKVITLLKAITSQMPQHLQTVKDLLVNIKDNSDLYLLRLEALKNLILISGEINLKDEIANSILNDSNPSIRKYAMDHYNFPDRKDLLKQRIQNDNSWFGRVEYVEDFLKSFVLPEDLKFIVDYSLIDPDENARESIENRIFSFIPPEPDSTVSTYQMSVNLLVYNDSLYSYGWTTTQTAYNNHKTKLTAIKAGLTRNPIPSSVLTNINSELATVESEYTSGVLTTEAYVFLKYHLTYIKDRIT